MRPRDATHGIHAVHDPIQRVEPRAQHAYHIMVKWGNPDEHQFWIKWEHASSRDVAIKRALTSAPDFVRESVISAEIGNVVEVG